MPRDFRDACIRLFLSLKLGFYLLCGDEEGWGVIGLPVPCTVHSILRTANHVVGCSLFLTVMRVGIQIVGGKSSNRKSE